MTIRTEAEACASSAPVGMFGLDDLAIAIQVIEFGFQLWHACAPASSASDVVQAASVAKTAPLNYRKARRRITRSVHAHASNPAAVDIDGLTHHMLDHVSNAPTTSLAVCCSEPPIMDQTDD